VSRVLTGAAGMGKTGLLSSSAFVKQAHGPMAFGWSTCLTRDPAGTHRGRGPPRPSPHEPVGLTSSQTRSKSWIA
jgi:hypothetical protein